MPISTSRQIVAAIDAALLEIASYGIASISINGKSQTFHTPAELLKLRNYYVNQIPIEEAPDGVAVGNSRKFYVRYKMPV